MLSIFLSKVFKHLTNYYKTKFILVGKDYETSIDHWIGISSYGINLYSTEDKLNPKKNWAWTQVDDLNYKYVFNFKFLF